MATVTNISQASVGGLKNLVGAYERRRMWISNVVSHHFGFLVSWAEFTSELGK
jgi:hypothetical protein